MVEASPALALFLAGIDAADAVRRGIVFGGATAAGVERLAGAAIMMTDQGGTIMLR